MLKAELLRQNELSGNLGNVNILSGVTDHEALKGRDKLDQHPIESISGLRDELDGKLSESSLPDAVNEALKQAKESGEFKGDKGDPGQNGVDGYTPIKGVDYFDGEDGYTPVKGVDYFDGKDGAPGQDGFSPVVSVQDITGGHRVTITDKDGDKTFDVMDGKDGEGGGGGSSVQSDWSQNDPEQADYVKNRTHWLERPFEPIVWDGSTEGRDFVDVSLIMGYLPGEAIAYKVSDHVLTKEEIAIAKVDATVTWSDGQVFNSEAEFLEVTDMVPSAIWVVDYTDRDELDGTVICTAVSGDFTSTFGIVIPSTGTYVVQRFQHSININAETYHTINRKFLPVDFGAAIIDVTGLPINDVNEKAFYRLASFSAILNNESNPSYRIFAVEDLPEVGEAALQGLSFTVYVNVVHKTAHGYVDEALASLFGVSVGWYDAEVLLNGIGINFGGIVSDISECVTPEVVYFLANYTIYCFNERWVSLVGRSGKGKNAEIFNDELNNASGDRSHAEGYLTTASGGSSHAEGDGTTASGDRSHAEGDGTTASGGRSHAEGDGTTASGGSSHAEGDGTTASGPFSHAEGYLTTASGGSSHAEGYETIASGSVQHVQGRQNIEDTENKYAHIVGNGTSGSTRSNAHTLDWDGNAWYAGYVEGTALILPSPNGTRWRITVDDSGNLVTNKKA